MSPVTAWRRQLAWRTFLVLSFLTALAWIVCQLGGCASLDPEHAAQWDAIGTAMQGAGAGLASINAPQQQVTNRGYVASNGTTCRTYGNRMMCDTPTGRVVCTTWGNRTVCQ
jgi:hypothetical protein